MQIVKEQEGRNLATPIVCPFDNRVGHGTEIKITSLSTWVTLRTVAVSETATWLHVIRGDRLWLCRWRKIERILFRLAKPLIER